MERSIFEVIEDSRVIDWLLFMMAFATPVAVALALYFGGSKHWIRLHRHQWVMAAVVSVLLFVLWKIHNAIIDHFGLDSVKGLLLSLSAFVIVAVLAAIIYHILHMFFAPADVATRSVGPATGENMPPEQSD